jgi:predicted phage baseplate assembly protein
MPLKDSYPAIDDRRFADLVAEARTRIPRYTPEWTDLNENEPGMALVQLMAWMSDLLLARLGRVPQLNYLKFLELIGIELEPAQPASVEIVFPVLPTVSDPSLVVPMHTQVATEPQGDAPAVVFETERALVALAARLDAVQIDQGATQVDVSEANAEAVAGFAPFGPTGRIGNALMLGFDSPLPFPNVAIDLAFWIATRTRGFRLAPLYVTSALASPPPAALAWEYWNGKDWIALTVLKDETAAFTRSGHVRLAPVRKDAIVRAAMGAVSGARFWLRARLAAGAYQSAPMMLAIRTNAVPATAAQTIDAEILGRATGAPNLVLRLAQAPVVAGSLALEVDEGDGFQPWTEVPDFFAAAADDPVYVLNRTTGEVRFADKDGHGRIPVANATRPANVVARRYRVGGGAGGNVAADAITQLRGHLPGIDAGAISNLFAASGGGDEETLAAARERAGRTMKSHERAVTAEDFELHAQSVGGVVRAKALPLAHPGFPGVEVPGTVSVIVVPQAVDPTDPLSDPAPRPTEGLLRQVCAELDRRRLATTELFVVAPTYRRLEVSARLIVSGDVDLGEVQQDAVRMLRRYFHPLVGGEDATLTEDGSGWPFGGDANYSRTVQRLLLPGVRSVEDLLFTLEARPAPACSNVALQGAALFDVEDGAVKITVEYEVAE